MHEENVHSELKELGAQCILQSIVLHEVTGFWETDVEESKGRPLVSTP